MVSVGLSLPHAVDRLPSVAAIAPDRPALELRPLF